MEELTEIGLTSGNLLHVGSSRATKDNVPTPVSSHGEKGPTT